MDLEIRAARLDDGPAIGSLTEAAYRADGYLDGGSDYATVLLDGPRRVREATVLLAERDGELVGTVTVTTTGQPWAEVARAGELEVRMLAVSPSHRRQGIAEALMAAADSHAREQGLYRVVLCTGTSMYGAQRLYEHLGFERLPERDWTPVPGIELISYGHPVVVDDSAGREDNCPS